MSDTYKCLAVGGAVIENRKEMQRQQKYAKINERMQLHTGKSYQYVEMLQYRVDTTIRKNCKTAII